MKKEKYHKRVDLENLKISEITRLEELIKKLGYDSNDYKLNHYGSHSVELIVTNQELHRDLKTIRRTKYSKK
jgi:hypothetical protein